jgi:hypothetical protein
MMLADYCILPLQKEPTGSPPTMTGPLMAKAIWLPMLLSLVRLNNLQLGII